MLFAIFLLPFVPDVIAGALAGLSAVSWWHTLLVSIAGRLPGMALTAAVVPSCASDKRN